MASEEILLRAGESRCRLLPALGGSLAGWRVDGQDMLRGASDAAIASGNHLALAAFPLIPWSNRIGSAAFDWHGTRHHLQPNFAPEPHAIHGTGWEDIWTATRTGESAAEMTLRYEPDGRWPWPFAARQLVTLGAASLTIVLEATNLGDLPVPLACGWHPYFDADGAWLRFQAAHVLRNGPTMLPLGPVVPESDLDFREGAATGGRQVDNCFTGWDGRALMMWHGRRFAVLMQADTNTVVAYVAPDGSGLCVEPVQHVNDALNRPELTPAMPLVAPGKTHSLTIHMRAVDASALGASRDAASRN